MSLQNVAGPEADEELMERARQLHETSVVVDTGAPVFTSQLMFTEGMKTLAREMVLAGRSRSDVKYALGELLCEEIERDPTVRDAYVDHWDRAGVTAANCSIYDTGVPWGAWDEAIRELATAHRLLAALNGALAPALNANDILDAHAAGRHTIIHNMQNTDPLDEQLDRVQSFYGLGVRILQITYNLRNRFGDGCLERRDGGLSRLGEQLVGLLNDLGILIDLSHCSDETVLDALEASNRPIACTHTSIRAISGHARAKPDHVLRRVGESGGYIGILLVPFFIVPPDGDPRAAAEGLPPGNATLEMMVDHIEYALNIAGSDAVGIGTDWSKPFQDALRVTGGDGLAQRSQTSGFDWVGWRPGDRYSREVYTAGFESWDFWPNITRVMLRRGLSEETVEKVLGKNFIRVFADAVPV
jgi:membrane dipeptidase